MSKYIQFELFLIISIGCCCYQYVDLIKTMELNDLIKENLSHLIHYLLISGCYYE